VIGQSLPYWLQNEIIKRRPDEARNEDGFFAQSVRHIKAQLDIRQGLVRPAQLELRQRPQFHDLDQSPQGRQMGQQRTPTIFITNRIPREFALARRPQFGNFRIESAEGQQHVLGRFLGLAAMGNSLVIAGAAEAAASPLSGRPYRFF